MKTSHGMICFILSLAFLAVSVSGDVFAEDGAGESGEAGVGPHQGVKCAADAPFKACGGTFEGRWKLVEVCATEKLKLPPPVQKKACPEVETTFDGISHGDIVLEEDGTGTSKMDVRFEFAQTAPNRGTTQVPAAGRQAVAEP